VTGTVEAILAVMSFIMEKIKEKPDLVPKPLPTADPESKLVADRSRQVSLLLFLKNNNNDSSVLVVYAKSNSVIKSDQRKGSLVKENGVDDVRLLEGMCI